MSLIKIKKKIRPAVGKKDVFRQNTLPQNAVALKKVFSKYRNEVSEEVAVVFVFFLFFCFVLFVWFLSSFSLVSKFSQ